MFVQDHHSLEELQRLTKALRLETGTQPIIDSSCVPVSSPYLKTYPLQALMGELFGLSQPRVNYWIHRLLPVLREALDEVGVLPERTPVPLPRVNRPPERDLGSSSMARNGGAKGRKTLKNRPRTTAGRRKPTATRTWSSWMLKVNVLGS